MAPLSKSGTVSVPLCHLPLRPSSLERFQQRGFVMSEELEQSKTTGGMANLAAELGVSLTEAAGLLREVQGAIHCCTGGSSAPSGDDDDHHNNNNNNNNKTAKELLLQSSSRSSQQQQQQQAPPPRHRIIVTFCRSIDQLLGGGIALGEVTEIAGLPGVGKTQLAMQLCVDARLPPMFGGVGGEAVYLDTEGSFSPERCHGMAQAFVEHVRSSAKRRNVALPPAFVPETILDGIHLYRIHDEAAQTATIGTLPTFLEQRAQNGTPVRLVIIDSIAFHYRCAPPRWDYVERTRNLTQVAGWLADIANKFDVAVVAINQMTTKFGGGDQVQLVPALGESWAHSTTTRLLLSHNNNNQITRTCTLVKSPHKPSGAASYQVLECGIRDVFFPPDSSSSGHQTTTNSNHHHHSKRFRTQY